MWRVVAIGLGIIVVLVVGVIALIAQMGRQQQVQSGEYSVIQLPLGNLSDSTLPIEDATSLKINGQLDVSGSVVLAPSVQPKDPLLGQLYFDRGTNALAYYNGQQFVTVGGGGSSTTINNTTAGASSTTNVTNILGGQSGVALQTASPGSQQTGNFNVSGVGQVGSLRTSLINTGSGSLTVNAPTFTVQNAAGQSVISSSGSGVAIATGATTGVSGDISITTGNSSTTASGNITIDAGSGIIDGEQVEHKGFEGGLDNMTPWFGDTIAQSTAQAHTGQSSLAVTLTSPFWAVIENLNFPITPVTPGHNYHFSLWVRADTTPRPITATAHWTGGSGGSVTFTGVTDSTTGWTEMTANGIAPGGSTGVYFTWGGGTTGVVGEVHYFDDLTVTDLSSSSAAATLNIGNTNAKIITIGNLNQIGATTIRGGSGVDIQAGAGSVNMSGGAISIAATAASQFSTTAGALTISAAATSSWGVGTASAGVGGNLTLHAGNGGSDTNNDGGDLILQGGNKNGTGIGGSVVVKPQSDATDAFQVQNSTGTALLVADTTAMKLSVTGTTTTFASLTLANAHFASTQTNPPTIGTPANCGTTPTSAVTAGSTDAAGSFTITTGTGGTSSTCDTVFTFNQAYGAAPKSIIVVGKGDAASAARQAYVVSSNATSFTLSFGNSAAGANSTAYNFSYWVIE